MRKIKVSATLGYIALLFICLPNELAVAQNKPQAVAEPLTASFDLKNGDRVVFLGNSLFENDFQYGYLELALTTRWPDRDVTYRNIGWTGDNVFSVRNCGQRAKQVNLSAVRQVRRDYTGCHNRCRGWNHSDCLEPNCIARGKPPVFSGG